MFRATANRHEIMGRKSESAPLERARSVLLDFPGVEEGPCYGTPGFRVVGKFLARLREDGETLVVKCGFVERDLRMQYDPETFFTTEHYRGHPSVLVHLTRVRIADLHDLVEAAWRLSAPKRLVRQLDERLGKTGAADAKRQPRQQ
jgi:hypothetical protein